MKYYNSETGDELEIEILGCVSYGNGELATYVFDKTIGETKYLPESDVIETLEPNEINEKILSNPEFQKLKEIGGCKDFHNEGDAYVHTMLVYEEAKKMFGEDSFMTTVAILHDIGKIYTGWQSEDGDFHYPNHSGVGAQDEYLSRFVDKDDEMYSVYQWYIKNHIKPLFWKVKGVKYTEPVNALCTPDNLRKLAICDINGSYSAEPQDALLEYLKNVEFENNK